MAHDAHGHDSDNSIFKIGMNLTIACLLSGAIIAGTYAVTAPVAAKERVNLKNKAMKELVADAQSFKAIEGKTDWYTAEKDGKIVAYVVPAESKGYGGAIKMLTAVTPEGKIIDYKILAHNETPGLGDKASEPKFSKQFAGKKAEDLEVVKVPTDKNIQALTGATITSRAVTKGIREAVEQVAAYASQKK
ncbi:MAG TPA: RnfABCDGE type electron transport complex subunit G [Selenomonadales bacterium]|nr:RnfABCDGE type electron transport complex subunit G [Selenomonadales bacterium]